MARGGLNFVSVILAGLVLTALSACRQEVRFTQIPLPVTSDDIGSEAETPTTIFVAVPVRLHGVNAQVEQAVPQNLKRIVGWLDDAACFKVRSYTRCEGARVELYLRRDEPVKITPAGDKLNVEIAFQYVLKSRGLGPARKVRETTTGRLLAVAGLQVSLGQGLRPTVQLVNEIKWSRPRLKALSGQFDLKDHVNGRIRRLLRQTPPALQQELQKAPLMASASRVWKALHQPIALQSEPNVWLTTRPEHIADGGFVQRNGKPVYRIAIGTYLEIIRGSVTPQSQYSTPMPRRGGAFAGQKRSKLRVAVPVSYEPLISTLKKAWPASLILREAANQKAMRLRVNEAELFPSNDLVALGLDIDVETPDRAFNLTGKAYLTARPVIDVKTGELSLQDIKLAQANVIPGIGAGTGRRFRLRADPFIEGIKQTVRINVAAPLADLVATSNAMLNQDIGNGLWLHGRFDRIRVGVVVPQRNAFSLEAELEGELFISVGAMRTRAADAQVPNLPALR